MVHNIEIIQTLYPCMSYTSYKPKPIVDDPTCMCTPKPDVGKDVDNYAIDKKSTDNESMFKDSVLILHQDTCTKQ